MVKVPTIQFLTPGLGLLATHLSVYFLMMHVGIPPLLSGPILSSIIDWVLWDPKLLLFRLHDMGLSLVASCYSTMKQDWSGLKQLLATQLTVGAITEVLKRTVGRLRPNGSNTKSFPSGHASAAFTGAAFVHQRYGLKKAIPAYCAASVVGCVRVYKQAHYSTDVIAGAGIALLTAYQLVRTEQPSVSVEAERSVQPERLKPA